MKKERTYFFDKYDEESDLFEVDGGISHTLAEGKNKSVCMFLNLLLNSLTLMKPGERLYLTVSKEEQ